MDSSGESRDTCFFVNYKRGLTLPKTELDSMSKRKLTTKFEEEPVFIDLTLMPSLIVYIPLFISNVAMRVTTRSSLRVNSYLQTVFSGEFPIHLLLKAYGIKT